MSFTHTLRMQWSGGGRVITKDVEATGAAQTSISETVADSETNCEIAFTMDVSEIAAIYIVSSQDVTLETNSGSEAAETISLVADVPYVWHADSYYTNLLATDITALFVTNASGEEATFQLEVVYDPTP